MFSWRGIEIQFGRRGGYPGFRKRMTLFLEQLCQNLAMRFPNANTLNALSLLNPKLLPVTAPLDSHEWTSYEMDSVETCLLTFHNAGIKQGVG